MGDKENLLLTELDEDCPLEGEEAGEKKDEKVSLNLTNSPGVLKEDSTSEDFPKLIFSSRRFSTEAGRKMKNHTSKRLRKKLMKK